MKKKIAIFANGWNSENLFRFIDGMSEVFEPCSADLFLFLSYASYGYDFSARRSESTVYDIPDLSSFDGAVVFGPGLNFAEVIDHIFKIVDEAGIPVISVGIRHPGTFYVGTDNYVGMKALADHIMDKHGVKKLLFVAGSAENNDSNERIRAVRDAMNERNLPFGEEDIFYSDWETGKAVEYILGKYSMEPLPDAIVCANDLLAMDISVNLDNLCVSTPEDVILTGFDFLGDGQLFYPSIASVDQRYDLMGAKAAEHLFKLFDGTETEEEVIVACEFKLGESCGCGSETTDRLRHKLVREIPLEKIRRDNSDVIITPDQIPLSQMDYAFLNAPTKTTVRKLFIAKAKETLGMIRGKFSGRISIMEAEANLDYMMLINQGQKEYDAAMEELTKRLERMSPYEIMKKNAELSQNMADILKQKPLPMFTV